MPNEEILSALKNAIDHGESLESAVQIMIDSGYNSEEVQEASKFIKSGTLSMQEIMPEEHLTMPEEKENLVSRFKFWKKNKEQNKPSQIIQKPFESMRLSSEPLNNQKIIPTQTIKAQQLQTQQYPIQQYPQQPIKQAPQQIQPLPPPMRQSVQQLPQYPQQITQAQIKQSFQHPIEPYSQQIQPIQQTQKFEQPIKQYSQYPQQNIQQQTLTQVPRPMPRLISRQGELSREIKKIKPAKQGYMKEIILLIILLVLIGVLVTTILFKDTILGWFA